MKSDSVGLVTRAKTNLVLSSLILAFVVLFGLMVAVVYKLFVIDAQQDQRSIGLVADLRASSFRLVSLSRDAISGSESAFGEFKGVVTGMDNSWQQLRASDDHTRAVMADEFATFDGAWTRIKQGASAITDNKDTILFLHNVARNLNQSLPELQARHKNVVDILLDNNAPAEQVQVAQNQTYLAERIGRNVDKMLVGGEGADKAADQFNIDASVFGRVLNGMKNGDVAMSIPRISDPEARASLDEITKQFEFVSGSVRDIFEAQPALFKARIATNAILDDGPTIQNTLNSLTNGIGALPATRPINYYLLGGIGLADFICLLAIFWTYNQGTSRRAKATAETNERNQNAILRLLDELADLADGDLTTTATVTEDFTGAIADSINYTIDQLRVLVSRINETSERVASGAAETQQTALHLAEASEHQAQEIAGASAAVNEMAVTIDQVSANAAESAGVAERSVSIASNGAKVVQNTINGMDTIREQIQDTAKRIKRLGESSQEIGDIVSLINDIADQTNILALNAAIQASMAGDAGRGFAVVADEVQRLAERSATATKQIEALVKTIQNDTNDAVTSMEQTTAEVVRGARLAQDAGVALEEIETVSANLAELIQNISNAARQQASSAGHISNTMNVIQEITSQTSAGTNATAKAIGNLSGLADELRESVTDFKLPEEMRLASDSDSDEGEESGDIEMDMLDDVATLDDEVVDLSMDDAFPDDATVVTDMYDPDDDRDAARA